MKETIVAYTSAFDKQKKEAKKRTDKELMKINVKNE